MRRHAERSCGKERGRAEAEHEARGEHRACPVTFDGALDRVESSGPEQAREHRQCCDPAAIAAAGQIDDPVGANGRDAADQDYVTKTEYVLMRQDAGGEQGQVLGHRKANATAQQDEEQPDEACLPAQDAADSDGPVRIPSVLVKNVPDT